MIGRLWYTPRIRNRVIGWVPIAAASNPDPRQPKRLLADGFRFRFHVARSFSLIWAVWSLVARPNGWQSLTSSKEDLWVSISLTAWPLERFALPQNGQQTIMHVFRSSFAKTPKYIFSSGTSVIFHWNCTVKSLHAQLQAKSWAFHLKNKFLVEDQSKYL